MPTHSIVKDVDKGLSIQDFLLDLLMMPCESFIYFICGLICPVELASSQS